MRRSALLYRTIYGTILAAALSALGLEAGAVKVSVNLDEVKAEVPRTIYGTGMEDVNHEIYGGLDAQRLWDESFEEELSPQVIPYAQKGKGGISCGRQWEGLACGDGLFARDAKVAHFGKASELLAPGMGSAGVANRSIRLVVELGRVDYEAAAETVFAAEEWIASQDWTSKDEPSPVQVALKWLRK